MASRGPKYLSSRCLEGKSNACLPVRHYAIRTFHLNAIPSVPRCHDFGKNLSQMPRGILKTVRLGVYPLSPRGRLSTQVPTNSGLPFHSQIHSQIHSHTRYPFPWLRASSYCSQSLESSRELQTSIRIIGRAWSLNKRFNIFFLTPLCMALNSVIHLPSHGVGDEGTTQYKRQIRKSGCKICTVKSIETNEQS